MFKKATVAIILVMAICLSSTISCPNVARAETMGDYSLIPPFVTAGASPLVMLVLGRDHKLYFPAYNDAIDLDADGIIETHFKPSIEYYGYFDSNKCYSYNSSASPKRFDPFGPATMPGRTCDGSHWSGNFLNYLTMSRMDCMRKVFYGGYRVVDTTSETVLERVLLPMDTHSWGKEYCSIAHDGYDIRQYTPLSLPTAGFRHLFANTTPSSAGDPTLRVLPNNFHRIYEWVSKERPEADTSAVISSASSGNLPNSSTDFSSLFTTWGRTSTPIFLECVTTPAAIAGTGNPCAGADQMYESNVFLSKFTATLTIKTGGKYSFGVEGDDSIQVRVKDSFGTTRVNWVGVYGEHDLPAIPPSDPANSSSSVTLAAGNYTIEVNHAHKSSETAGYYLFWKGPDSGSTTVSSIVPPYSTATECGLTNVVHTVYGMNLLASALSDYSVRVKVGVNSGTITPESNCKRYGTEASPIYKPVGILQRFGASDRILFGLMTGSYSKNLHGGVLRKKVSSISNEIDASTGVFTSTVGIIKTLDRIKTYGYSWSSYDYGASGPACCPLIVDEPLDEYQASAGSGACTMWGNPIAEMMYETLRYFAGHGAPTTTYDYGSGTTIDSSMNLPRETDWSDPYATRPSCSKPFMVVISDIYPSYDTDDLPGASFGSFSPTSTLTGKNIATGATETLNVTDLANAISTGEGINGHDYFVGQSGASAGYTGACTAQTVGGFGNIRGLCPDEPTKEGGYYSAAVAHFGRRNKITSSTTDSQSVTTYTIGLSSPNPNLEIPVGDKKITVVPFAKSTGTGYGIPLTQGAFQPTNQNAGFYLNNLAPNMTSGEFMINWEDAEQGNDFDQDVLVVYKWQVIDDSGNAVSDPALGTRVVINLRCLYSSQGLDTHSGFTLSGALNPDGTDADGPWLVVKDIGNAYQSYWLDYQNYRGYTGVTALTTSWTGVFKPKPSATGADLIKTPLWYAAKWGGFEDADGDDVPDLQQEWDKGKTGTPDTYFYVTSPLKLENALNSSFSDILRRAAAGTAASVISSTRSGEGAIYQALFYPEFKDDLGNTVNWVGEIHSMMVDSYGNMREDTNGNHVLDVTNCPNDISGNPLCDYILQFSSEFINIVYKYNDANGNSQLDTDETASPITIGTMRGCRADEMALPIASRQCIAYLWSTSATMNAIADSDIITQRSSYDDTSNKRYIFTFIDGKDSIGNIDMIPQSTEIVDFTEANSEIIKPYLHMYKPIFGTLPGWVPTVNMTAGTPYQDFLSKQAKRIINYIRGQDQGAYTSSTSPAYTIPAMRPRISNYDESGTAETWRLGDIVYSTPTVVAAPSEDFDLLYKDTSYIDFYRKYRNRRIVIYAGGNDGMLHAFNAGFYSSRHKKFCLDWNSSLTDPCLDTGRDLGTELWAYVPYNLLPHLYWLTDAAYTSEYHVNYVDLKPRIFDAKIFAADTDHPNGWGTVMVVGMRFGGGKIRADLNHDNTYSASSTPADRIMRSSFFVMDITNPEVPPKLLAEISDDSLGFTTCYPAVLTMKDKNPSSTVNDWYLVLGSGPHGATGPDGNPGADNTALTYGTSDQPGKIVLVSLNNLAQGTTAMQTLDGTTDALSLAGQVKPFSSLDTYSFISDPIAVDYDLDYKADSIYYGTVMGGFVTAPVSGPIPTSPPPWGGKLRRLVTADDPDPATWIKNSVLIDLSNIITYDGGGAVVKDYRYGQPIVAAPAIGKDASKNCWVFFGTGRFYNRLDATDATSNNMMSYYGIKEPATGTNPPVLTWATVERRDLLDVTQAQVFEGGYTVQGVTGATNFDALRSLVATKSGWLIDFVNPTSPFLTGERNLGQATLLGDILTFTTYTPSTNVCKFEGTSVLYACYYGTGTAYPESVIGLGTNFVVEGGTNKFEVLRKVSLGQGLTLTPNIHTGREDGSNVYVQTSTGTILQLKEANPGMVKSGKAGWEEWMTQY